VQALDAYDSPAFEVGAIVLVQSHLGEGPGRSPRYEVRHRFALGR
jgi:2'-5' RNA ligase